MLGRANYLALVGGGKQPKFPQNKVIIWDDAKQKAVVTLEFRTQVHRVRLSRSRIVVALQNSVHIYAFQSPPEKLSVFETADNHLGLCCLGAQVLAFPGRSPGQVQVVELNRGNVSIIPAHGAPLKALELSPDGKVLATASETVSDLSPVIAELRRGVDHATILSLAISPSSTLLAVTSDKSTLHVFDLPHVQTTPRTETAASKARQSPNYLPAPSISEDNNNQKWGVLGKIPLLPRVFSDVYSFTSAHFELDDEPQFGPGSALSGSRPIPIPGIPGGRPPKGIIGWTSDDALIVIGAGRDGRWEKFVIGEGDDSKRRCVRDGWRRYLGGGA
ncbi:MAG: Phosphatidylinositol 3,5-bisphosphate-binding protein [Candelaria pacifica]|nr:MAG: Phosphatidylinositol 3,5-bisphosphate-binding protein [Candelaria pacifica]